MKNSKSILLIENDMIDEMTFKRAVDDLVITNPLVHFTDCREALKYLTNKDNEKPWIIIADLYTPQMSGFEFLTAVKAHDELKHIIVIIMSGSKNEEEITKCFSLGAAGFMVKHADYNRLVEMISAIHTYWSLSELPHRSTVSTY